MNSDIIKIKFIFLLTILATSELAAQNIALSEKRITWYSSSFTNLDVKETSNKETIFISGPAELIWSQDGYKQIFKIKNRKFDIVNGYGKINYKVQFGDARGRVKFTLRPDKKLGAIIKIKGESSRFHYSFSISEIKF